MRASRGILGIVFLLLLLLALGAVSGVLPAPSWLRREAVEEGALHDLDESHDLREEVTEARDPSLVGRARAQRPGPESGRVPPAVDFDAVDRAHDLHGRVVREDGTPVAGARIAVVAYPWRDRNLLSQDFHDLVVRGPETRSAADGTFAVSLVRGALLALRVSAEGLAPFERQRCQPGERLEIVLKEPARLRVLVRGPEGEGVGETKIRLFQLGGGGRTVHGTTDADGVCLFADLNPGRAVMLDVEPPHFGYPGWVEAQVPETGETTVEVDLVEGRTIHGRVTDAATGEGIARARVGMNWVAEPFALTDEEGRYELVGWTGKGISDLHVLAEGYARGAKDVGAEDTLDFALVRGAVVRGRVVTVDGRGLEGARVCAVASQHHRGDRRISLAAGHTSEHGAFELGGLTPDMPHTLIASTAGHGRVLTDFDPVVQGEGVTDLGDIALPSEGVIRGVVVGDDDVPVRDAEVRLKGANEDRAARRGGEPAQVVYGVTLERRTDDLGRFLFPELSPGRYELRAWRRGGVPTTREIVLEDADVQDLRVRLVTTREVRVLVEDEYGEPVSGCTVSPQGGARSLRTDAEGAVTLRARPGALHVQVHPFGDDRLLPSGRVTVEAGGTELRVVLRRAVTIRGRLVTDDGRPMPRQAVRAEIEGRHVALARTDADGAFVLKLEAGPDVDLVFDGSRAWGRESPFADWSARQDGVPRGREGVELRATKAAADRWVDVLVLDPDGSPVEGVTVWAVRSSPGPPKTSVTDAEGRCRLEGLRPEPTDIRVPPQQTGAEAYLGPLPTSVTPDGQELVLRLRGAAVLNVRITGLGDPRAAPVRVRVLAPDGRSLQETYGMPGQPFGILVPVEETGPFTLVGETTTEPRRSGRLENVRPGPEPHVLELVAR